jgi:hypothetical protein
MSKKEKLMFEPISIDDFKPKPDPVPTFFFEKPTEAK